MDNTVLNGELTILTSGHYPLKNFTVVILCDSRAFPRFPFATLQISFSSSCQTSEHVPRGDKFPNFQFSRRKGGAKLIKPLHMSKSITVLATTGELAKQVLRSRIFLLQPADFYACADLIEVTGSTWYARLTFSRKWSTPRSIKREELLTFSPIFEIFSLIILTSASNSKLIPNLNVQMISGIIILILKFGDRRFLKTTRRIRKFLNNDYWRSEKSACISTTIRYR